MVPALGNDSPRFKGEAAGISNLPCWRQRAEPRAGLQVAVAVGASFPRFRPRRGSGGAGRQGALAGQGFRMASVSSCANSGKPLRF